MNRMSKLKIWVMSNEFQPHIIGGLGIAATSLTEALSKAGVKVTVLTTGNTSRMIVSNPKANIRIIRIPQNSQNYSGSHKVFKPASVIRAVSSRGYISPDIIHVHSTDFVETAHKAKVQFGAPIVYSCHSLVSQSNSPSGRNQKKLFRIAQKIIVPSKWQAREINKRYRRILIRSATVIPHGVHPISKNKKGPPNKLLYVGRLVSSKGLEPLIRAIASLARTHNHVHLTIIGRGHPSYQRKLKSLARRVGVANRISWVKNKPHRTVQRMYASYGAVVIPSKTESFCLVALEAMANGVPLISTLSGGLKEFVNKHNAQIIRAVDSASISNAIRAFLSNPTLSQKRRKNALISSSRFRWPAIAKKHMSLFMKLKKGSRA